MNPDGVVVFDNVFQLFSPNDRYFMFLSVTPFNRLLVGEDGVDRSGVEINAPEHRVGGIIEQYVFSPNSLKVAYVFQNATTNEGTLHVTGVQGGVVTQLSMNFTQVCWLLNSPQRIQHILKSLFALLIFLRSSTPQNLVWTLCLFRMSVLSMYLLHREKVSY